MGLNKLISMSKNNVLPDFKTINQRNSKSVNKANKDRDKTVKIQDLNGNSEVNFGHKSEKLTKGVKVPATTKKSLLWNTLRITNKNKNPIKKGNFPNSMSFLIW